MIKGRVCAAEFRGYRPAPFFKDDEMKNLQAMTILILALFTLGAAAAPIVKTYDQCVVTKVVDGDTLYCDAEGQPHHVRLRGVDAPETFFGKKDCYGKEAREYVAYRVQGTDYVKVVVDGRDAFGRELGYVFIGDSLLNLDLVVKGYARAATQYKTEYVNPWVFWFAEQISKTQGFGMWGACKTGAGE